MTWEYALAGLVVGIIIGAVVMRFGSKKLREQRSMQYELEKTKAELADYRDELTTHFARSAELLDNLSRDHRLLHQHVAKGSQHLLSEAPGTKTDFSWQLTEAEADNDQAPVQIPRDYSEGPTGLLRAERPGRD